MKINNKKISSIYEEVILPRDYYWTSETNDEGELQRIHLWKTLTDEEQELISEEISESDYEDLFFDETNNNLLLISVKQRYNYINYTVYNDNIITLLHPDISINLSDYTTGTCLLDKLAHHKDLPNIKRKNGTILKKYFNELYSRVYDDYLVASPITQQMLEKAHEEYFVQGEPEGNFYTWLETLRPSLDNWFTFVKFDYFTNKVYSRVAITRGWLHDGNDLKVINFSRKTRLEDYNYKIDAGSSWIIPVDHMVINDQCVPIDNVRTEVCSYCNTVQVYRPVEDTSECICKSCEDIYYKIHSYSTKVPSLLKFKAKNVTKETIFYGIELEYETETLNKSKLAVGKIIKDHAIMKSDGSIHSGFEIVTCPATSEIHLEEFKKFFDNFSNLGVKSASNVGMHIHISRKPLNYFTVGKMAEFLNRPDNKTFIELIAGRSLNNYCQLDAQRKVTYPFIKGRDGARYNTLNLNNEATVELRIFKTPESYEEFAAKLQFAEALTDYCKPCAVSHNLKQLTSAGAFTTWVKSQGKQFRYLNNFLKGL